jgi:hypothetical protein
LKYFFRKGIRVTPKRKQTKRKANEKKENAKSEPDASAEQHGTLYDSQKYLHGVGVWYLLQVGPESLCEVQCTL